MATRGIGKVTRETSARERADYTAYYRRKITDAPAEATQRAQRMIARLARSVPAGAGYLGIGAGRGITEGSIHRQLSHLNVLLLDVARRKPLLPSKIKRNVINIEGNANTLPLPAASVSLASCILAQDFFGPRRTSTQEMLRVLRPGGRAVVFLHHPQMFETELRLSPGTYSSLAGREVAAFWRELMRKRKVYRDHRTLGRFFRRNGFIVESVAAHTPGPRESPSNYWWEVQLRKPG